MILIQVCQGPSFFSLFVEVKENVSKLSFFWHPHLWNAIALPFLDGNMYILLLLELLQEHGEWGLASSFHLSGMEKDYGFLISFIISLRTRFFLSVSSFFTKYLPHNSLSKYQRDEDHEETTALLWKDKKKTLYYFFKWSTP